MLQPEYRSLRRALENKGYTLRDEPHGPIVILAAKGSIEIFANLQRRVVGIGSETSAKDLLIAYEDLEQIYEELGIEPSNLMFYEFVGIFSVTSKTNPLQIMETITVAGDTLRKIGSILKKDIVTLGLSLTIKDGNPTSSEWLHLIIEPLYVSARKKYRVRVIFRGKKQEVIEFVKRIEKRSAKIIEELEGR